MPDELFLVAARTLAEQVSSERLASGALYPRVADLRSVTRAVALAVARTVVATGVGELSGDDDVDAAIDAAMWWPDYVPYLVAEDRRSRHV
jgi:malic enzyme